MVKKLSEDKTIIYHGYVEDMKEIYKNVHCTVHPSYYPEGLSNVLLESLACSRPIITTNRSGCKEVIEDRINGFEIKQNDLDSLIEAVKKFVNLTNDEKKQMGINGRQKVENEFDRNIVINKYLEAIEEVTNG